MASPVPTVQKAAVLNEIGGDFQIRTDFPVTQPDELKPGQCLVKLECTGVCRSDLSVKNAAWGVNPIIPLVGGHEGIGIVVAIGAHTSNASVKIGDRVGLKWFADICRSCEMCQTGHENVCSTFMTMSHGFQLFGTFQQYAVSYVDYVTPIPEGLDSVLAAPVLCAGVTVLKALKQANVHAGQWIAIAGAAGGLGHFAIQYAVASGLRVVAIGSGDKKKELALDLGAEKWVDYKQSANLVADVLAATGGTGPHAALVTVGDSQPCTDAAMYLRSNGTLVAVGMPKTTTAFNIPINLAITKGLKIIGSLVGNRQDVQEALDFVVRGKVKPHVQVRDLSDINEVLRDLAGGKIAGRVVLTI